MAPCSKGRLLLGVVEIGIPTVTEAARWGLYPGVLGNLGSFIGVAGMF